jgi:hypothetical protein
MNYRNICELTGRDYYKSHPIMQDRKKCSKCHKVKQVKGFCKNGRYTDNYHPWCIECTHLINDNRRIQEYFARPKWFSIKHKKQLTQLKNKAGQLTKLTDILHSICHKEPIQHWLVCGLDMPENMYVDTQENNANSSNEFNPYRIDENGIIEHIELSKEFIINAFNFNEKFNTVRNQRYRERHEERSAA